MTVYYSVLVFRFVRSVILPYAADPMEGLHGFERLAPPGHRDWHRGHIDLPTQAKMSNCDVLTQNRPQHIWDDTHSPWGNTDRSAAALQKGLEHTHTHHMDVIFQSYECCGSACNESFFVQQTT